MDTKFTDREDRGLVPFASQLRHFPLRPRLLHPGAFLQRRRARSPTWSIRSTGSEGVFAWRNGKAKLFPHFWVGDRVCLWSEAGSQSGPGASASGKTPQSPAADPPPLLTPAGLRTLLYCCLVLLIGYFLGGMKTTWERQMTEEGAVYHYGLWTGLRPGLHEQLAQADDHLGKIAAAVAPLAKEHVELSGDDGAEKKEQWAAVSDTLTVTRGPRRRQKLGRSPDRRLAAMVRARE